MRMNLIQTWPLFNGVVERLLFWKMCLPILKEAIGTNKIKVGLLVKKLCALKNERYRHLPYPLAYMPIFRGSYKINNCQNFVKSHMKSL